MQAQPDDLDTVIAILEEAAEWLWARGIRQWEPGIATARPKRNADAIQRGEIYLALLNGQPVGTLMLQWLDRAVWGNVPDDAVYVHQLAIRRAVGGRGIGLRLLHWAEEQAVSAGKRYLRLDCWAENADLCAYYERADFTCQKKIDFRGWKAVLYEKQL